MNKVVLYIKDSDNVLQAVDLFEDETISVTSKIQDIRDISKVFTDFSQSFTVPASKKNNKIFRHFYNYFISEGAFDARKKVDARLEINYIPFREGKIFLNGVKMKNNKPFAYNVTFFGNTVTLKDLLGDDELESLTWLDNFAYEYDNITTKNKFSSTSNVTVGSETFGSPIIVPLITHTKRLFFNSNNNSANTLSGNIAYQSGGGTHHRGVSYLDLKPAVRLTMVIRAIEEKYGIEFTKEFFSSTSNFNSRAFSGIAGEPSKGLYMWLSREKGGIGSGDATEYVLQNFTHSSGDTLADFDTLNITPSIEDAGSDTDSIFNIEQWNGLTGGGARSAFYYVVKFDLTITTASNLSYDLTVVDTLDDNKIIAEFSSQEGTKTFSYESSKTSQSGSVSGVKVILKADSAFTATTSLRVRQIYQKPFTAGTNVVADGYYTSDNVATVSTIRPTERMPKMKIYDFLTGIFKMFNLTAYYIDDLNDDNYGKIRVLPLDEYYDDDPKIFDITKYVDSTETGIESTIPFSEVEFKYKEAKTLLMIQHKEAQNEAFGDSIYKENDVDRGKPYKVETKFEHLKFERLFDDADSNGTTMTDIVWGYSAGDNFKPDADAAPPEGDYDSVLTAPLLFYGTRLSFLSTNPDQRISWLDNGTHSPLGSYWMPSNGVNLGRSQNEAIITGDATSTKANSLVDSGADFDNVSEGDVVVNTTTNLSATVLEVVNSGELLISGDIFVSGDLYKIYGDSTFTINFDSEINEYSLEDYGINANSLFKRFYKTYIEDVFNARKRIFKVTAHLPNSVLVNYELNDRFQIGDKVFTINSIDTNLKTGESKLELLNVL